MVLASSVVKAIQAIVPERFQVFTDEGDVVIAGDGFEITIKETEYSKGVKYVMDNMRQDGGWLEFLERVDREQEEAERLVWLN